MAPSATPNRCSSVRGLTWWHPTQVRSGSGRFAASLRLGARPLRGRLDIDPPAGQLGRQPGVLAVLADRQGELVLRHMRGRRPRFSIDVDAKHLRRAESVRHQLVGIVGPGDDVDPLGAELADDAPDPHPAGPDAGTYRVDAILVGGDR